MCEGARGYRLIRANVYKHDYARPQDGGGAARVPIFARVYIATRVHINILAFIYILIHVFMCAHTCVCPRGRTRR